MREVDFHYDGHGLNESILIETDTPDQSGAAHLYECKIEVGVDGHPGLKAFSNVAHVQFQKGPRNVEGSIPGMTEAGLLAILIDRLRGFQSGPYSCRENAIIITKLEECLLWTKYRADERAKRGVLGRNAK